MNKKNIKILLAIFFVLTIIASSSIWTKYLGFGKKDFSNNDLAVSRININEVEKISIKDSEAEVSLIKEDGAWKVNSFDASATQINNFFEGINKVKTESLVSKNPQNHFNFNASEEIGVILSLIYGDKTTSFIIGDQGPDLDSFYIKKKDSNNLYLASGGLKNILINDVSFWRDKKITDFKKEAISKVEIVFKKDLIIIRRIMEGKWQAESVNKTAIIEEETANRFLESAASFKASAFLSAEEEKEFIKAKNKDIIRFFIDDKTKIAELSLLEKEEEWWVKVEGKEIFYKVDSSKVAEILLTKDNVFTK